MSQSISEPTTGEYDAINFDGLERRANYRTIAYREDILHILEHKDAAAIIYQIISRWQTEIKRPQILKEIERRKQTKQPPLTTQEVENMMWVYMSYNDFVRESGGAVAYNTVIRMMHYLVNTKKVIEQRENHDPRYPDYEYRINKDTVKELLKALPTEPAFSPKVPKKKEKSTQEGTGSDNSTQEGIPPDGSTQMGTESTQEGRATTQMGTEVYPNGGTSHITHNYTHNYNTEQERESSPNTLDTHTIVSSDTAHASHSQDEELFTNDTPQGDTPHDGHANDTLVDLAGDLQWTRLPGQPDRGTQTPQVTPQGDTHATAASGHPHRVGEPTAPGVDGAGSPSQDRSLATPEVRPVLEAQEITEGDTHATRVPTVPRADHPASLECDASGHPQSDNHCAARAADDIPVVYPVGRGTSGPQGSRDGKDTSPLTPAQSLPLSQDAQVALGPELVTHCYLCGELVSREPVPGPLVCESCKRKAKQEPKWNAQAMVAKACELRGKPFSDTARPKETKAAQKLFDRKPDLDLEEFEKAWKQWDTQWWRDTNGLFNLTDLAAVPKSKSEMRLIIALEKLERAKPSLFSVPTKQSTFVPRQSKIEVPDDFIQSAYSYR